MWHNHNGDFTNRRPGLKQNETSIQVWVPPQSLAKWERT